MANWSLPTLTSTYTNFVSEISGRLNDSVNNFSLTSNTTTATNVPTNAMAYDITNLNWSIFNGSIWSTISTTYNINVATSSRWLTSRSISATGDIAWSATTNGSANASATATLATVNSNVGAFGSTTTVPIITVNAKGLITAVSTAALGTIATQDASSVTLTGGSITGLTTLGLPSGTGVNTEGLMQWDNTNDLLFIGTGATTKQIVDTVAVQTLTNKTLTAPIFTAPVLGTPDSGNFSTGTFTWPTFNQSTTGSAASCTGNADNITGTLAVSQGGTGATANTGTGNNVLAIAPALTGAATIDGIEIGYKNVPQNAQSANYTLVLGDSGEHIYSTNSGAQTLTVPTNATVAFPIGTAVTIVNNGTTSITFITTSLTVYKAGTSAAWASGGTIAIRGMATLMKVATDTWFISGTGLS